MIIIIIILSIFLFIALTAWRFLVNHGLDLFENDYISNYFTNSIVEEFPCILFLTGKLEEPGEENMDKIVDFSMYEEYGIIGLTEYLNGEEGSVIIPNQKIVLLKDGSYEWDIRPYL